ncbi:hypothetical protein [Selenihalanaerobacter shriftii]|uniref:Uncharacterized protein n=1 Tax=Selenihalanaerobacter shriftii TaxID=142842 RepID=A0A1T4PAS4_9FIRM|nr:hypothetical protein [Selenihalanaerobacter shriftii]SJZ88665.1 hypothetical protein SAMN02745118_02101 [Selenihalanaerobacter shriftii]
MEDKKTFVEIVSVLEELKILHDQSSNDKCKHFIKLKLQEVYYKASRNNMNKLAEASNEIYQIIN